MTDLRAASLVLVCLAGPAFAQSPGTGDDRLRELVIDPAFVVTELPVLAIRGGNPEDTLVLFDGFEVPWGLYENGVRSIASDLAFDAVELNPGDFGVEYGRGSSLVALSSEMSNSRYAGELTVMDAAASARSRDVAVAARIGSGRFVDELAPRSDATFFDATTRLQHHLSRRWTAALSGLTSRDGDRQFIRTVVGVHYASRKWTAKLAFSPLQQLDGGDLDRLAFDTRAELVRRADDAIGLTNLEWQIGQQTNSTRMLSRWTHDVGMWTSVAANVSASIRATVGLRVDNFDGDAATQPRAQLVARPTRRISLALAAGAYRRPPNQFDEVGRGLAPERATHTQASAAYQTGALRLATAAYYIDRTRLVITDPLGNASNSGIGTSRGIEASARFRSGAWDGAATTAWTRSKLQDFPRAAERPSEYEQPFRLDVIGAWSHRALRIGARMQIASGLPYTPFAGAVYDSDNDRYEPLYVPALSARPPLRHQLDVRIDYRWRDVTAFVDLHNAYRNRAAIAYQYSYDFSQRTVISALPVFPFVGVRGVL